LEWLYPDDPSHLKDAEIAEIQLFL